MLFVWFNVVESIEGRGREPVVIPTPDVIHTPALPLSTERLGARAGSYTAPGITTCSSPPSLNRGTGAERR